jgi:hypothetical protein
MIPNPVSSEDFDKNFFFPEKNRAIYAQLKQGDSFQNPVQSGVNNVNTSINGNILPIFDDYISGARTLPTGFTLLNIMSLKSELENNFLPSQTNFLAHTNLLSGVTLSNSSDIPNLRTIISVGSTSTALDNALNNAVGNPCGKLLNAFGALFLGQDLYNEMTNYFQALIALMELEKYTFADVGGQFQSYKSMLDSLVQNDKDYFQSLIQDLLYYSLSSIIPSWINDPCGRYMLEKVIGSKDLLNIL